MTEEDYAILQEVADIAFRTRCEWKALVQMLIDQKLMKGTEEEIVRELELRAKDIMNEELRDAKVSIRARALLEAWSKLPKQ